MASRTFEEVMKASTPTKAPERQGDAFSIFKTDDDKRLVFGWASISITVDGEQLEDRQKDIIDPEDLEEAAYEYVLNFRDTGEEHISTMRKKGKLVESCVFTAEKQKAIGIPEGTIPIGWWIGFKIEDEAAWQRVKNGTYRMFSIEGKANREPVEKGQLKGCGVLVVQNGKILSGTRIERGGRGKICGPGGHIEPGETPEEAAKREAWEEFGITCRKLTPLGTLKDGTSAIFLCTKFAGTPETDEEEMTEPKWRTIEELRQEDLFAPFERSLEMLESVAKANPHHDSLGRFASGPGGGKLKIAYTEIERGAIEDNSMAANYMMLNGVPYGEALASFQDGTAASKAKKLIDQKYADLQSRYDHAPEGQKKFMQMSPQEAAEFVNSCKEKDIQKTLNGTSTTQKVVDGLNLHQKPEVVSREEFEKIAAESPSGKMYRGVVDNGRVGISAKEISELTVNGEKTFIGDGMHGDGIYFTTKQSTAASYAGNGAGSVLESCISPKARIADLDNLTMERSRDPNGYEMSDISVYAIYKGYNAIKLSPNSSEDYYIALDRTALVFPNDYTVGKAKNEVNGDELGKVYNEFTQKTTGVAKTFNEVLKFNPFHDAKGRFASANGFATYSANPKTKAGALAISRSAQGGHGTTFNSHKESQGENITQNYAWLNGGPGAKQLGAQGQLASQQPKTPPQPQKNYDSRGFADYDAANYHQLYNGRQYYKQQQLTTTEQNAAANYLSPYPEAGSLYSHCQNMNYMMATGQTLTGQYKKTHDGMMSAMHNIGYNVELTRYDHAGFLNGMLKSLGAGNDYERMSQTSLQKALVGQTLNENKFLSTSYNNFKNASNATVFTSRAVKINYKVKAGAKAMMPGVGPGGDFGEMVLAPTNGTANKGGKIVGVRLTGKMARRQGTQSYNQPQIEIDIEIG